MAGRGSFVVSHPTPGGDAAHTFARAAATAGGIARSPEAAVATAEWVSTTPGSWVCPEIPHSAMDSDIALVRPLRSASSVNSAVPPWDSRFSPSTVTPHPVGGATTMHP